MILRRRRITRN